MSTNIALNPDRGVALFTDGSAYYKNKSGGWAWVAIDAGEGLEQGSGYRANTTISQMELQAAIEGLRYLAERYGSCEVLVYSDSEYVVLGAMDRSRKRNKNKALWKFLDKTIANHVYVEFLHVRGHNNHRYNEMADALAGAARIGGQG